MWKDKGLQLVMLPTKEETSLIIDDNSGLLHKLDNPKEAAWGFQYLYLLSDEKIKEGDKYYDSHNNLILTASENSDHNTYGYKKIIASTDPSLNLPQFHSSFLEEYVKRYNSKKSLEVEVKYEFSNPQAGNETCDDFSTTIYTNLDNTISIRFKEEKKPCTHKVVAEAMRIVSKDVRIPKVLGNKYNVSEKELRVILNLGMTIRQDQLNGHCSQSGNEILTDWIKENLK